MNYAIIRAGGKQHRVTEGERLRVDLMAGKKAGEEHTFDDVLMLKQGDDTKIGTPRLDGVTVSAKIVANGAEGEGEKAKKVIVFKKIRRHQYQRKQGHRQRYTEVQITKINA